MIFVSRSNKQTKEFAAKLAKNIFRSKPHLKHARVIALVGDLGAGKTTFTQGFARGLGIRHRIVSPTFLIFRSYPIKSSLRARRRHSERSEESRQAQTYKNFYHADVYRINSAKELAPLDFKKILENSKNIVLIEWADKIKNILPKETIWVTFIHRKSENERQIDVSLKIL